MALDQHNELVLIMNKIPFQKKWKVIPFSKHIQIQTTWTEAIQQATELKPIDIDSFMNSCPVKMTQITWSKAKDYLNEVKQSLNIELSSWLNNLMGEPDESRTIGTCSGEDFPQILCPDMPLNDLYVAQYISDAETNMKKEKEDSIENSIETYCDFCLLKFENRSVTKYFVKEEQLIIEKAS